ncbi:MAG TPA: pilin [Rhodanobacteraceae bacterium]|nr:pilin [Rhodanobacteraceae bacterium]
MSDPDSLLPPVTPAVRRLRAIVMIGVLVVAAALLAGFFVSRHRADRVRGIRAQVADAIATADGMRSAVALYRARNDGAWPYNNTQAGLLSLSAVSGKYVDNTHIENGRIVITLGGDIARAVRGKHIVLTPYLSGQLVLWRCESSEVEADLLPESCRD